MQTQIEKGRVHNMACTIDGQTGQTFHQQESGPAWVGLGFSFGRQLFEWAAVAALLLHHSHTRAVRRLVGCDSRGPKHTTLEPSLLMQFTPTRTRKEVSKETFSRRSPTFAMSGTPITGEAESA